MRRKNASWSGSFVLPIEIIKYKTDAELEASLNKVKNPKLKNIIKLCFENNILYKMLSYFIFVTRN